MPDPIEQGLTPSPPQRNLDWPGFVHRLGQKIPNADEIYIVGGAVRNLLRGRPVHDLDLVSRRDGTELAREIADSFKAPFFPLDQQRRVGRAILQIDGKSIVVDVATIQGDSLLADLEQRDFSVNAMAVRLDSLMLVFDPLNGQRDLLETKTVRQCNSLSIGSDPIRALRAIRIALDFGLHLAAETKAEIRTKSQRLVDSDGEFLQPERIRDELFKLLALPRPAAGLRLLNSVGLLEILVPTGTQSGFEPDHKFAIVEALGNLFAVIAATRNDNTAADLTLGLAVMTLDRFRAQLQENFSKIYGLRRPRTTLSLLTAYTGDTGRTPSFWTNRFRLSNQERNVLSNLDAAMTFLSDLSGDLSDREIFQYFRSSADAGVDGVLLCLARYLAGSLPSPDPGQWGHMLDNLAVPMLEAYFLRHESVISPVPFLSGDDLQQELMLTPGPNLGAILDQLIEEQAAGVIGSRGEALRFARQLAANWSQASTFNVPYGPTSSTSGS